MILLFAIMIMLLAAVLFLKGEGEVYGKGEPSSNDKKGVNVFGKNFFV